MTRRWREALALGLSGAALGALVAVVLHLRTFGGATTYHGRYVPMQGLEMSKAYESTLNVTFDDTRRHWLPLLPICIGVGLAVGLVVFGVLVATGRRIALVSASSPIGSARR